ncbi:MAG: hypothetical protein NTX02_06580 [Planctomycetia bacterium]|nr:hypothetical protein [Planctomycetia bacterium]
MKFTSAARRSMRLTREQSRRGIPALEAAGLLRVVKGGRGRCTVVEIIETLRECHIDGGVGGAKSVE